MVEATRHQRFRFSIRTLMIAIALCALFLAPLIWMLRHLELQVTMERMAARAQAERALYLAQILSAQAALNAAEVGAAKGSKSGNLWAGISANHSTFKQEETKNLRIEFSLVNDGDEVIDPRIPESRVIINGKELADSVSAFSGFGKHAGFNSLSPGESLRFDWLLGDYFKEPGIYQVSWKGTGFLSSEVVLRVLPEKAR
jgi:hypothetical protein